jgi:hypothetical protein
MFTHLCFVFVAAVAKRSFHTSRPVAQSGTHFESIVARNAAQQKAASNFIYNNFLRSTATYTAVVAVGAVVGEYVFSQTLEGVFNSMNRGKSFKEVINKFPAIPAGIDVEDS